MTGTKKDSIEDFFQTGIGILAAVLTIYGFVSQSSFKILIIGGGIILLYIYTRTWIKDFIAKDILTQNKRLEKVEIMYQKLKEDMIYMKGWMAAINNFKGKGGGGAIDPLTLFIVIVLIILAIAYFQGKLT